MLSALKREWKLSILITSLLEHKHFTSGTQNLHFWKTNHVDYTWPSWLGIDAPSIGGNKKQEIAISHFWYSCQDRIQQYGNSSRGKYWQWTQFRFNSYIIPILKVIISENCCSKEFLSILLQIKLIFFKYPFFTYFTGCLWCWRKI